MKRERKKNLTAAELRSAGLTPDLVTRKVRSAGDPDARKKFLQYLTSNTTNSETGEHSA